MHCVAPPSGQRMSWHPEDYVPGLDMWLGASEVEAFDRLPRDIKNILIAESEDPLFIDEFLVPALRTPNPRETILSRIAAEAAAMELADMGMGSYEDFGLGKSFFKKVVGKIRDVHKKVIQKHREVAKKVLPKAVYSAASKVGAAAKKVWRKYGNTILGIVGGILAPFTGGASAAAAAVLIAANTMYQKKKAADEAKKMAKADAAQQRAAADAAERETMAQVDKFFNDNREWFAQYNITPETWAKMTLDQKIDIINAGAKGTLPQGIGPEVPDPTLPPGTTAPPPSGAAPPSGGAPPPSGGAPSSYPVYVPSGGGGGGGAPGAVVQEGGGGGGGGEPQYGPPPSAPGGAPPPQEGQTVGTFDLMVEGVNVGTYSTLEEAAADAIKRTVPGDRFEVIANGQSTGLRVRTSKGSIDVPPDIEAHVRAMPREKMAAFVAQAEKETSGGFPWWILLVGGGVVAKVAGVF